MDGRTQEMTEMDKLGYRTAEDVLKMMKEGDQCV
nr:MAG TPA: hypothetical protein [Caudoviricetes sp.]